MKEYASRSGALALTSVVLLKLCDGVNQDKTVALVYIVRRFSEVSDPGLQILQSGLSRSRFV
jgi:hypothetical protein